ncbi:MAG: copper homeostasis protein CutC [Saprospiraceae bacterium]
MNPSPIFVEVCCNSLSSALAAQAGGAHRIELCADLEIGGTTPSPGTIKLTIEQLKIPVCVLIRPRPGDFIYTAQEKAVIFEDIAFCKKAGCAGIVIGALNVNATIDEQFVQDCLKAAGEMDVVFHRAFDFTRDPFEAMETLIRLGVKRVLTSGQQTDVMGGRELLRKMVLAAADRIEIMPGSGIHENNLILLSDFTGARIFHMSARNIIKSINEWHPRHIHIAQQDVIADFDYFETSQARVEKVIAAISK